MWTLDRHETEEHAEFVARAACRHVIKAGVIKWCLQREAAMVWIDSWDTFYAEAEKLYTDHPDHVRTMPSAQHTVPSAPLSSS